MKTALGVTPSLFSNVLWNCPFKNFITANNLLTISCGHYKTSQEPLSIIQTIYRIHDTVPFRGPLKIHPWESATSRVSNPAS